MDPVATPVEHESDALQESTSEEDEQIRDGNAILPGQNGNVEIKENEDEQSKNASSFHRRTTTMP